MGTLIVILVAVAFLVQVLERLSVPLAVLFGGAVAHTAVKRLGKSRSQEVKGPETELASSSKLTQDVSGMLVRTLGYQPAEALRLVVPVLQARPGLTSPAALLEAVLRALPAPAARRAAA